MDEVPVANWVITKKLLTLKKQKYVDTFMGVGE